MRLTTSKLRQIIREELTRSLNEDQTPEFKWNPNDKYLGANYTGPLPHIREVLGHPPDQPWSDRVSGLPLPGGYIVLKDEDNTRVDPRSGKKAEGYNFFSVKDPLKHKSWSELMDWLGTQAYFHIFKDDLEEMTEANSDKNQGLTGYGAGLPKNWHP